MRAEMRTETWTRVKAVPFAAHKGPYSEDEYETVTGPRVYYVPVDNLSAAQGLWFNCPKCHATCGHSVCVGFDGRGTPPGTFSQGKDGKDSRWRIVGGSGLDDLQLAPSIQLLGGCNWHGFVGTSGVPPGEAR